MSVSPTVLMSFPCHVRVAIGTGTPSRGSTQVHEVTKWHRVSLDTVPCGELGKEESYESLGRGLEASMFHEWSCLRRNTANELPFVTHLLSLLPGTWE